MLHFIFIKHSFFILLTLGSPVPDVIQLYQRLKKHAQQSHHRQLLGLQGSQQWCIEHAAKIIKHNNSVYKWCGYGPEHINTSHYSSLLGQNVELLILNMSEEFDPNMFAAAEGAVCGGAVILLLLSPTPPATDYFYHYILQQLSLTSFPLYQQGNAIPSVPDITTPATQPSLHLSEQNEAIQAIIKTVTGHRRRPLVLTANRGRGKSAALGIAAASLINQGIKKILVCAPNQQAVATLYKHAKLSLTEINHLSLLQFIAPDALARDLPACDLLLIDEAAAIPVKLLTCYSQHYSRIVFATTQFGYEGSGRGFALRFQKTLKKVAPEYRSFRLEQPIRWAKEDPVEAFTLSSLCLIDHSSTPVEITEPSNITIQVINKQKLLQQPLYLNQLFSLLVNAHYQTKPSDLKALLNDTHLTIITIQQASNILGVALINHEGALDKITCEKIYQGKRRPTGHLVAQSLTFHSGFIEAGTHHYARLQRIAIQPALQNNTLGSQLLTWIRDWATQQQFDHLCASFAANEKILRFWLRHQLQVLRIGTRTDKSSGEHSFIVNLPLSQQGKQLHHQIQTDFQKQAKLQFSRQLKHLDSSLIIALWPQIASNRSLKSIRSSLLGYINANRAYDNVEYLLIELLMASSLEELTKQQQRCVIEKIIQNHSWQEIAQQHHFTGQKQAQAFIKNCISLLAQCHDEPNT